jgi:hypothetical protein
MRLSIVSISSSLAALALLSFAGVASAQEKVVVTENGTDHDEVVGHFAVGYFGISNLPLANLNGNVGNATAALPVTSIVAPVIGARYWISPKLGIDAGVGFSDSSAGWGFAIHGGVPLALATSKHMTFELIPEATVAFAGNSTGSGNTALSASGFLLDIGARIGGEIQFGFIGIPQLALQASVGVFLQHQSVGASEGNGPSTSVSATSFATSVQGQPWGIFTDNISALYYF